MKNDVSIGLLQKMVSIHSHSQRLTFPLAFDDVGGFKYFLFSPQLGEMIPFE